MIDETELPWWCHEPYHWIAQRDIEDLKNSVVSLQMQVAALQARLIELTPLRVPDPIPEPSQPPNHERSIKV